MDRQDRVRFAEMMQMLCATFRVEPSEPLLEAYWRSLAHMSLEDVGQAIDRAIGEGKHMPRPADLRRVAGLMTPDERAIVAFEAVSRAVRSCGHRCSVSFDDPVVNAAIRNLGGWSRACSLGNEEFEKWFRKDFCATYAALCGSGVSADAARHLVGADEAENQGRFPDHVPHVKEITTGLPAHTRAVLKGRDNLRLLKGASDA